ncbi:glycosyltransferase [Halomonas sp. OfavH-34-E]|uniref:glycosyltransferase n=1 Tax=Halomonas sp. OfavH-34-E TaxID=2954491 RepID=UPI0020974F5F|nr:glycosyltransferase [Halomonas sp. OfavH-34-E]MCO7214903.1 glycosyltransferase [Halomonas sp. OfavH-34-E]
MKRIVYYIVPEMTIGGVESGLSDNIGDLKEFFDIRVLYVKRRGVINVGQESVWKMLFSKDKPDLVITSLWWAHLLGFYFKSRGVKWVCFIHSTRYKTFPTKIISKLSFKFSDFLWADSISTRDFIVKETLRNDVGIIPFNRKSWKRDLELQPRLFDGIYVGRNSTEKRLDILTNLVRQIIELKPDFSFTFILSGQDVNKHVDNLVASFPLNISVKYNLPKNEVIRNLEKHSFFFLTSDFEGMSMATIEAIRAGCVPVVRVVGEMNNYLDKKISCISIDDIKDHRLKDVARRVVSIRHNESVKVEMNRAANEALDDLGDYVENMVEQVSFIVNSQKL